jgi:hypothetical protein
MLAWRTTYTSRRVMKATVVIDWEEGSARWEFDPELVDEVHGALCDLLGSADTIT